MCCIWPVVPPIRGIEVDYDETNCEDKGVP